MLTGKNEHRTKPFTALPSQSVSAKCRYINKEITTKVTSLAVSFMTAFTRGTVEKCTQANAAAAGDMCTANAVIAGNKTFNSKQSLPSSNASDS
ncbi:MULTISPECIES: hypothetical protein [Pseudosulfitobacter]|uniref:hypothetical protein n=1 Tax=Pseudosulfitobacter pseudonitzschiae TaxID=1402135 RepID=UPI0011613ECA|nr:hypothetical protein [Pseudosulfitobacter pseudonitzschiae]QKS09677.1 hypothetical protein HT745_14915 [Pseudosulfitobacter pseudonitzschiae]